MRKRSEEKQRVPRRGRASGEQHASGEERARETRVRREELWVWAAMHARMHADLEEARSVRPLALEPRQATDTTIVGARRGQEEARCVDRAGNVAASRAVHCQHGMGVVQDLAHRLLAIGARGLGLRSKVRAVAKHFAFLHLPPIEVASRRLVRLRPAPDLLLRHFSAETSLDVESRRRARAEDREARRGNWSARLLPPDLLAPKLRVVVHREGHEHRPDAEDRSDAIGKRMARVDLGAADVSDVLELCRILRLDSLPRAIRHQHASPPLQSRGGAVLVRENAANGDGRGGGRAEIEDVRAGQLLEMSVLFGQVLDDDRVVGRRDEHDFQPCNPHQTQGCPLLSVRQQFVRKSTAALGM
jgi:hypothetical protein